MTEDTTVRIEMDNGELVPIDLTETAVVEQDALTSIRHAIGALDTERHDLEEAGDYTTLANGAADIALLVADLRTLERETRMSIARVLDAVWEADGKMRYREDGTPRVRPKVDVDGLGRVEVESGMERKGWESDRLLRMLLLRAVTDEDGELVVASPYAVADAVYDVLSACLPITSSLGWRVGTFDKATNTWSGLRRYGIDPDDYCEATQKDRIAKVPRRNANEDHQ